MTKNTDHPSCALEQAGDDRGISQHDLEGPGHLRHLDSRNLCQFLCQLSWASHDLLQWSYDGNVRGTIWICRFFRSLLIGSALCIPQLLLAVVVPLCPASVCNLRRAMWTRKKDGNWIPTKICATRASRQRNK